MREGVSRWQRWVGLLVLLILAVGAQPAEHSLAQAGQRREIVFVIDGSGSISRSDFTTQKEGLKRAVLNPSVLTRDGSIVVGLVQFAGGRTRVEINLTPIRSENDAAVVSARIDAIQQIGGSTNPGDGVNTAMTLFANSGSPASKQSICLSTDGTQNSGSDIRTALANGRAAPIGLDRFSAVLIEDSAASARTLLNFYQPLVFGGGAAAIVVNSIDFASSIGGCISDGPELVAIEVNQAVQDWNNSVPLVQGKTTYVRAHVKAPPDGGGRVYVRLVGERNGVRLAESPLTPLNAEGTLVPPSNPSSVRASLDQSLYFRLPASWLNGTVDLRLEGVGSAIACAESAGTPNDCSVRVSFTRVGRLQVEFVPVRWAKDGKVYEPTSGDMSELAERLRAAMPIASDTTGLDWRIHDTTITLPDDQPVSLKKVLSEIKWVRFWDGCLGTLCKRLYYGVLVGPPSDNTLGLGQLGGPHSVGFLPDDVLDYGRLTHVHELAHNLGLGHAVNSRFGTNSDGEKLGPCRETGKANAPDFPFVENVAGADRATLGPMGEGADKLVYGLDHRLLTSSKAADRQRAIIDPNSQFELMSYCGPMSTWPSSHTYGQLLTLINGSFAPASLAEEEGAATTEGQVSPAQATSYLVVGGMIDLATNAVSFTPFGQLTSSTPPPQVPAGEYQLQLRDRTGAVLQQVSFQPDELEGSEGGSSAATFLITVPSSPAASEVAILKGGTQIGLQRATASVPTVTVLAPNGGEALGTDSIDLQWTGSDPDGDALSYTVQYSANGGRSWRTLAANVRVTALTVPRSALAASTQGRLRVMASDGFWSATDDSNGVFAVANNAPRVFITGPGTDAAYFGSQLISLDGEALDPEDGTLTGTRLVWRTNRSTSSLGSGNQIAVRASQLAEGLHTITLTATDRGGATTTTSINIVVAALPEAPPARFFVWMPLLRR